MKNIDQLEDDNVQVLIDGMPKLTDRHLCLVYKKAEWKSQLYKSAKAELQKRGIRPVRVDQIIKDGE